MLCPDLIAFIFSGTYINILFHPILHSLFLVCCVFVFMPSSQNQCLGETSTCSFSVPGLSNSHFNSCGNYFPASLFLLKSVPSNLVSIPHLKWKSHNTVDKVKVLTSEIYLNARCLTSLTSLSEIPNSILLFLIHNEMKSFSYD